MRISLGDASLSFDVSGPSVVPAGGHDGRTPGPGGGPWWSRSGSHDEPRRVGRGWRNRRSRSLDRSAGGGARQPLADVQGLMISTPVPSKSGRLRVASTAPRERQTAAIRASKPAIGFPARSRALAIIAYSSAAAASTGRICSSKARKVSSAVSSRACLRRPAGSLAMPKRISASVIEVIRSSRRSRRRTQSATWDAGSGRISSETTLVSRMIMPRNPRHGPAPCAQAVPAQPRPAHRTDPAQP